MEYSFSKYCGQVQDLKKQHSIFDQGGIMRALFSELLPFTRAGRYLRARNKCGARMSASASCFFVLFFFFCIFLQARVDADAIEVFPRCFDFPIKSLRLRFYVKAFVPNTSCIFVDVGGLSWRMPWSMTRHDATTKNSTVQHDSGHLPKQLCHIMSSRDSFGSSTSGIRCYFHLLQLWQYHDRRFQRSPSPAVSRFHFL